MGSLNKMETETFWRKSIPWQKFSKTIPESETKKNRFFFRRWLEAEDVKCLNEEQVDPKLIRDLFFCNNDKKMNLAAMMHLHRLDRLLVFPVFLISLCSSNPVTGKNENFFCSKIFFGLGRHCCRCFNKHSSKESRCHETPLRWFTIHSAWKLRKVWMY